MLVAVKAKCGSTSNTITPWRRVMKSLKGRRIESVNISLCNELDVSPSVHHNNLSYWSSNYDWGRLNLKKPSVV